MHHRTIQSRITYPGEERMFALGATSASSIVQLAETHQRREMELESILERGPAEIAARGMRTRIISENSPELSSIYNPIYLQPFASLPSVYSMHPNADENVQVRIFS
ncbi:hypothetical protein PENTCL1PPCAC_9815 [Pristionchus entomophagus]|uniref:Uncharacterized protein n=1 Tax=Pristionchus entomophagus TaxID=358040 RepID=A0AAV5SY00_9BILA|nr:hypothetical protein PENTCL1PPCAC_9815 [Pristionchus entomophagus]